MSAPVEENIHVFTALAILGEFLSKARGLDLHSGFNILKQRIIEVVGKPSDLVLSHPPYHNIVVYSGAGHADELSWCATENESIEKLTIAVKNQRQPQG